MTDIFVDFSKVEPDKSSIPPPGWYQATTKKATLKKPQNDPEGAPYIALELAIDEGEAFAGFPLFINNLFSLKATDKNGNPGRAPIKGTMHRLLSMGVDLSRSGETKLSVGPNGELLSPNLIGIPVRVQINHREYPEKSGTMRANVVEIEGKHKVETTSSAANGQAAATAEKRYA